jgi:hypothetical protein
MVSLFIVNVKAADLGPLETMEAFKTSMLANKADAIWTGLPYSWQADINSFLQAAGTKLPPELWDKSFSMIKRIGVAVDAKKDILADLVPAGDKRETVIQQLSLAGQMLQAIGSSDAAKVEGMKTIDMKNVFQTTGNKLMELMSDAAFVAEDANSPFENPFELIKQTKFTLIKEEGDTAVVQSTNGKDLVKEVQLVKVEGKWVPKMASDAFTKEFKAKTQLALASLDQLKGNSAQLIMPLAMLEGMLKQFEDAKTAEEMKALVQNLMAMRKLMGR